MNNKLCERHVESPHTIHVIFKTHLDVGFTDLAGRVVQTYVDRFIPSAIGMARALREKHGQRRFIWTTGSWLIHHYLQVASGQQRRELEAAILAGDIVWHGLPFTTHTELMDVPLFRVGLGIAQELDGRFGRKTIASKMTDVPGHTCAMLPLLQEAGIEFLHIGVNPASTPPAVPNAFRWMHRLGGQSGGVTNVGLNVIYDKGSYGGLTRVAGCADALYFAHTGDNLGPCSPEEVEQTYRSLEQQFPNSRVQASTLDAFAEALRSCETSLPVVDAEIGDTWIHGVGTDPWKVSRFRRLRAWRNAIDVHSFCETERRALLEFDRALLLVPEHTWGRDVKLHLGFTANYDRRFAKEAFAAARQELSFRQMESSWLEQRDYLTQAVDKLKGGRFHTEASAILKGAASAGSIQVKECSQRKRQADEGDKQSTSLFNGGFLRTPFFEIGVDQETGAINHLKDIRTGRLWADARHLLGEFRYEIFSGDDYDCLWHRYNRKHKLNHHWAVPDFLKPGIESAVAAHRSWQPQLMQAKVGAGDMQLSLELGFADDSAWCEFGAPRALYLQITANPHTPELRFLLSWKEKSATRVAEASWLSFKPRVEHDGNWRLRKMGQWVDPLAVVRNGNRTLHAVESVRYRGGSQSEQGADSLEVFNPDSPLVAPGIPSLVRFSNRLPRVTEGVHFNLHNNTWGTNFPLWYEDDASFEYVLRFGGSSEV